MKERCDDNMRGETLPSRGVQQEAQSGRIGTEAMAVSMHERPEAARRRLQALKSRVRERRAATEAASAEDADRRQGADRTVDDSGERSIGGRCEDVIHGRRCDGGGDGNGVGVSEPNKRHRQVEATSAAQNSAVVAREGLGDADLTWPTGTVAPHHAVATGPVKVREDATTLDIGGIEMVARPPDGAVAPSEDLDTGVAEPRGHVQATTSQRTPAAESGGRPPQRRSCSPQAKRRRRGAGPRIGDALGDGEGKAPPSEIERRRDGDNGPADHSPVAHGDNAATETVVLEQPETGWSGYTRNGARQRGCRQDALAERSADNGDGVGRRRQEAEGQLQPTAGEDRPGSRDARQAACPSSENSGAIEHEDGRQSDEHCTGGGWHRGREATPHGSQRREVGQMRGGGGEAPGQAGVGSAITDVGSLSRAMRQPTRAARERLLAELLRPRGRMGMSSPTHAAVPQSDDANGSERNPAPPLQAVIHGPTSPNPRCKERWGATNSGGLKRIYNGVGAAFDAGDSPGVKRRRLRGKQPPRTGVG